MPIPLILGAAGVVTNLIGAKKGADAAKSAAQTQQKSIDTAQQFNERAYADTKAALAPYQAAGVQSLAALQARQNSGPTFDQRVNGLAQSARAALPASMGGGGMPAPNASLAEMQQRASVAPMGAQPPQPPMGGGTVKIQAPTGEVRDVPMAMAQQLLAQGARRIA